MAIAHWIILLSILAAGAGAGVAASKQQSEERQIFSIPLDNLGSSTMFWSVDYMAGYIRVEVHAVVVHRGWFAVGFSDYGEQAPADYCVLWHSWRGTPAIEDTHVDKDGQIKIDDSQDCVDFRSVQSGNLTKFTFRRKFDTCDPKDYVIEDGTTHVVWATGPGPLFALEGVSVLNGASRGMQRVQLLKNTRVSTALPHDAWPLEVRSNQVHVPSDETTYWCHVVKVPRRLLRKHHVVKYEAVIQRGNEGLVHHMEVFHCEAGADAHIPLYNGPCFSSDRPRETQVCKRVLAAWAMGATPFYYPEQAGLPIGGPDFNPYVMLEVHYNNPGKKSDWVDSSGIRLTLSPTLRRYDGGVIELGLEYTDKMAIPPGQSQFALTGHCIAECTEVGIPPQGITVFGSQLHTHLTGVKVWTKHIRQGCELPELNRDNHYSSHFQEIRRLKSPVKVLPGDVLLTTCVYDTRERPNVTLGGHAITNEMCLNYIHYFPKVDLEVCKSSISDASLQAFFKLLHELDGQPTGAHLGVSGNYRSIQYTPLRTQVLCSLYDEAPIAMQCNRSSGARFPGDWSAMPGGRVLIPLPSPRRSCPALDYPPGSGGTVPLETQKDQETDRIDTDSDEDLWIPADDNEWGARRNEISSFPNAASDPLSI